MCAFYAARLRYNAEGTLTMQGLKRPHFAAGHRKAQSSMKADPIENARMQGFRAGVQVAADSADDYNSVSLNSFRLGDCIRAQFGLRRGKLRRNAKNPQVLSACKHYVRQAPVGKQELMQLAQFLDPEGWAKYARNKVSVATEVAERVQASIRLAQQLLKAGYRDCTPFRETPLKLIDYSGPL